MFYLEFDVFADGKFLTHESIPLNSSFPYRHALSFLAGFTGPSDRLLTISSVLIVEK